MIDVNHIKTLFAEKLVKSISMDEALLKAVWVSYKQGISDCTPEPVTDFVGRALSVEDMAIMQKENLRLNSELEKYRKLVDDMSNLITF